MGTEFLRIAIRNLEATYEEHRDDLVVAEAEFWLKALPPPQGRDKEYACQLSELWLFKAYAHEHLRQWDRARDACRKLIDMHPYPDSQNVFQAKDILRVVGELEEREKALGR